MLKSAEVYTSDPIDLPFEKKSTFQQIRQISREPSADIVFGEGLNADAVMMGNIGLNPLCTSMSVSMLGAVVGDDSLIEASLYLREHWAGKEAFVQDLQATHNVMVTEKASDYDPQTKILSVKGPDNIFKFGAVLRDTFESVQLEVDVLERPVVNPEVVGIMLELVDQAAKHSRASQDKGFHKSAYRHDWQP